MNKKFDQRIYELGEKKESYNPILDPTTPEAKEHTEQQVAAVRRTNRWRRSKHRVVRWFAALFAVVILTAITASCRLPNPPASPSPTPTTLDCSPVAPGQQWDPHCPPPSSW